jgi:hypothetical protein
LFLLMWVLSAGPASAVDLTLAWDPNTEPDLEGYGVYLSKDAPGPPYDLAGYVTTAELEDPSNPTFTVTGLVKGDRYYLALTAYDTSGAESDFSDAVCADIGDTVTACASSDTGGDSGGGGSGGGSGGTCFIGTPLQDSGHLDPWLAAMAGMAALIGIAQRWGMRSLVFSRHAGRKPQRRPNRNT